MRFIITRRSVMDIEGVDDPEEALRVMVALSKNSEGMALLFQGRPITYVRHIESSATPANEEPDAARSDA
jgi:hypothetical protein